MSNADLDIKDLQILALTMGEPAGVGADIAFSAWDYFHQPQNQSPPDRLGAAPLCFFLIDDPARLKLRQQTIASNLNKQGRADEAQKIAAIKIIPIAGPQDAWAQFQNGLPVLPIAQGDIADSPASPDSTNAGYVIQAIEMGHQLAASGHISGLVTLPIAKHILQKSGGFAFPGHTEFLAHLAGLTPHDVAMMLTAPRLDPALRVVPMTIHCPYRQVGDELQKLDWQKLANIVTKGLQQNFAITQPRLMLAGLNPHAGEDGHIGREEIDLFAPNVAALQQAGFAIDGPKPADSLFHDDARPAYDAVLCPYHDQALIPLKTLDFYGGVNVTLGLPYIRTSPDHGTAFSLAGTGSARPDSLIAAISLAAQMAKNRAAYQS